MAELIRMVIEQSACYQNNIHFHTVNTECLQDCTVNSQYCAKVLGTLDDLFFYQKIFYLSVSVENINIV